MKESMETFDVHQNKEPKRNETKRKARVENRNSQNGSKRI